MKGFEIPSQASSRSCGTRLTLLVAACIGLPLLALIAWIVVNHGAPVERVLVATAIGLAAAGAGIALSLRLVSRHLRPMRLAIGALQEYERRQAPPALPVMGLGDDDLGDLVRSVQQCLDSVEAGRRALERHALEDSLTDALNRRGAVQALRTSVATAAGTGAPFVLCVVDLDDLKRINDEHGHTVGDFALVTLVESAGQCCIGNGDWIGRWGGDEFLLGLHADPQVAMDRLRVWIDVLARPEADVLPVRVSVGCACWAPELDGAELYRQADSAMYQAKAAGGQRLVAHDAAVPGNDAAECA